MNRSQSKYFNTAVKMDNALLSLLNEKPFEYITVSDICKRANVNRSTFYLHYDNTCDLLNETIRHLLDDFCACFPIDTVSISRNFEQSQPTELIFISPKYVLPYLTYIRDNRRIFLTALSHADQFGFEDIFHRMFLHIFNPILSRFHYPEKAREYVMRFYLSGITAIVAEWLKNDCEESLNDLCQIIHDCIFGLTAS